MDIGLSSPSLGASVRSPREDEERNKLKIYSGERNKMKLFKNITTDYTVVPNEVHRHNLSLKAIGLYSYILSKNDGWSFSINGVKAQVSDGRASIETAIKELEDKGFLYREQQRENGKLSQSVWYVTDFPKSAEKPFAENLPTENPPAGNQRQVNNKEVNNKEVNNKHIRHKVPKSDKVDKRNNFVQTALIAFKDNYGHEPVDRYPRQRAWNLIQKLTSFAKERGYELTEDRIVDYVEWAHQDKVLSSAQTMDAIVRHLPRFKEAIRG